MKNRGGLVGENSKTKTLGKNFAKTLEHAGAPAIALSSVLLFGLAFSSDFTVSSDAHATDIAVNNTARGYYADISTLGSVDIELQASPSGAAKIGKDTLTVGTNADSGYRLYISTIQGATGNGLYLEDDDTKSIASSAGTTANPVKLATNTWGYVASRATSTGTATEYTDSDIDPTDGSAIITGVPTYGNENLLYTNTTPGTAATNTLDVYYGVNASTSLPSGNYSNTVVYTAIVDESSTAVEASIAPAAQNGIAAGTNVNISTGLYPGTINDIGTITVTIGSNACTNITPSLDANGSLGISCVAPAQTNYGAYDVTVNVAKYSKTYVIDDAYEYINANIAYMQDFNCAATLPNVNDSTTLVDKRDGKSYTVARLADGNCWMTKDLQLGGDVDMKLTSVDSNVTSSFTLLAENTGTWCMTQSAECYNQSLMIKTGTPNGYLYNWYAATAGSGTYEVSTDGQITTSICPKGWTLPTGGPGGQFSALSVAYGGPADNQSGQQTAINNLRNPPTPGFNWTGYRYGGSIYNPSDGALYWSRTAHSSAYAYDLDFNAGSGLYPQNNSNKDRGFAVRCIAST